MNVQIFDYCTKLFLLSAITLILAGCNFKQESAVLYRGPSPSLKRLDELKAMGIKTIISVRKNPTPKKVEYSKKIGLNFFHVRTSVFETPSREAIQKFISIANNPKYQPVYVCCVGGKDRTAFYVNAYQIALGKDPELALADMKKGRWRRWWPWFHEYDDVLRAGAKDGFGMNLKAVDPIRPAAI